MSEFDPARRELLRYGALAAGAFTFGCGSRAAFAASGAPPPLSELGYAQVQLAPGPHHVEVAKRGYERFSMDVR